MLMRQSHHITCFEIDTFIRHLSEFLNIFFIIAFIDVECVVKYLFENFVIDGDVDDFNEKFN